MIENCVFRSDYSKIATVAIELISSITLTFSECVFSDMLQTEAAFAMETVTKAYFTINECNLTDSGIKVQSMELFITNSTFYNSYISAYNTTIILMGTSSFLAALIS